MGDITREEIERWRAAFAEMLAEDRDDAPGDSARLLAAAEASLDHPAALEAARAEERERWAGWIADQGADLHRAGLNAGGSIGASLIAVAETYRCIAIAMRAEVPPAIRALGPAVEQPAAPAGAPSANAKRICGLPPESCDWPLCGCRKSVPCEKLAAAPPKEPDAMWLAAEENGDILGIRVLRVEAEILAEKHEGATVRPMYFDPPTTRAAPPALPPDLRERVVKVLEPLAARAAPYDGYRRPFMGQATVDELRAARDLLSALREPPEWLPTHQHEAGDVVRLLMWLTNGDVVVDDYNGVVQAIGRVGFTQWFRPLTSAEARAAMEAGRG